MCHEVRKRLTTKVTKFGQEFQIGFYKICSKNLTHIQTNTHTQLKQQPKKQTNKQFFQKQIIA